MNKGFVLMCLKATVVDRLCLVSGRPELKKVSTRQSFTGTLAFILVLACSLVAHATNSQTKGRKGQSLTLLPNGQILLAGGYGGSHTPLAELAITDTSGNVRTLPVTMQFARAGQTATVLPDGRILIFGGYAADGNLVSAAEILDPTTWHTSPVPNFRPLPRAFHTATVLTDGTMLMVGGVKTGGDLAEDVQTWDYRTGTTLAYHAVLSVPRQQQTATLLPNGNVQVSGGLDGLGNQVVASEEYDVASNRFSVIASDLASAQPTVADSMPVDGATAVQITDILAVRFSSAMLMTTLSNRQLVLQSSGITVPVTVTGAEAGRLVFAIPASPLQFGTTYTLTLDGVMAPDGQQLPATTIQFTTQSDPQDSSDEEWVPGADAFNGQWSTHKGPSPWQKLPALQAHAGVTALSGQVLRLNGSPLARVLLQVDGIHTYSDSTGRFLLQNVPGGHHALLIDGRTANRRGVIYGLFEAGVTIKAALTVVS